MDRELKPRELPDRREGPRRADEMELQRERQETIYELNDLFFVVQEMGQRLADETHGGSYDVVRELNLKLHEVRTLIDRIQKQR